MCVHVCVWWERFFEKETSGGVCANVNKDAF